MAGYIGSKASVVTPGAERKKVFSITTTTTSLTGLVYTPGFVHVFHNGVRLVDGTDYTATDGSTVTLTTAAQSGDEVVVISYATFQTSDTVSASAGGTFTGDVTFSGNIVADGGTIKLDGNYPVGSNNVALGNTALDSNVSGASNTAIGADALTANTASNNTAVGYQAAYANTTGQHNTFLGRYAGHENTTASDNVAVGSVALYYNTTGTANVAVGRQALNNNTTASNNTAMGYQAGLNNTTGAQNTAVGSLALYSNTTGIENTAQGFAALDASSTGNYNTAFGAYALTDATTASDNTAVGRLALGDLTTGTANVSMGKNALRLTTTGSSNTSIGHEANYYNTTGQLNVSVGRDTGYSTTTGYENTFVGAGAGLDNTTGYNNTYIGRLAGRYMTGVQNTIVGRYNGNQGGLNLTAANNHVVLSDGSGNPRLWINSSGHCKIPDAYTSTTGNSANLFVDTDGRLIRATSSLRYKNTVTDATHGLAELMSLRSVTYKGNDDGEKVFGGLIAEEVHDAGLTEFVQYNDEGQPDALAYGNMVSLCIKAIQEQQATIEALEARIATLETN